MLKKIDKAVLAGFIVAQDTHRKATVAMAQTELLVKSPTQGLPLQNPYLPIVNRQMVLMTRVALEPGLYAVLTGAHRCRWSACTGSERLGRYRGRLEKARRIIRRVLLCYNYSTSKKKEIYVCGEESMDWIAILALCAGSCVATAGENDALRITSEPSGARVIINGWDRGTTPFELKLGNWAFDAKKSTAFSKHLSEPWILEIMKDGVQDGIASNISLGHLIG